MRSPIHALIVGFLFALCAGSALAVDPQEQLKDPLLEARAREISAELRCLVCQNQSIDDSDASLAKDLRLLVRQQLQKGESNKQVIDYIVARYGEFVLLNPRLHWNTLLLWFAPIVLVAGRNSPGCPRRRKASAARDRKRSTAYARGAGRVGVGVFFKGRQARLEVVQGPIPALGPSTFSTVI